ncbi:hypothetical protein ACG9YX_20945, partial [Acinetobacter nematophilus]
NITSPTQILTSAATIALTTSLGACVCCYLVFKAIGLKPAQGKVSAELLLGSFLNISYAFIALTVGYAVAEFAHYARVPLHIST